MWPGFKSRCRRHMRVKFIVGSLLCSERFFSGHYGQKPAFSIRFVGTYLPIYLLSLLRYTVLHYNYIWLLPSFSVPLFSFSLYNLLSPSNNCHTGSNDISNSHIRIPACTAEVFFGQGTGQSPKDIGSTFLSSSEDLPDDLNIVNWRFGIRIRTKWTTTWLISESTACSDRSRSLISSVTGEILMIWSYNARYDWSWSMLQLMITIDLFR